MKKSELSFKCVLGSEKRNKRMYDAIVHAGIKNSIREEDFVKTAMCLRIDDTWNNEVSPTYASKITESYESASIPEVSFQTAIEMLKSIEPDAPEFDIKLCDNVLIRSGGDKSFWNLARFAAFNKDGLFTDHGWTKTLLPLKGNESFLLEKENPAGWWECENGKPVWKTK